MIPYSTDQLNQFMSLYKLLGSNAGPGSIITTVWGGFAMPMSTSEWPIVQECEKRLQEKPNAFAIDVVKQTGVVVVEDERFVRFLKAYYQMQKLRCLIGIPAMEGSSGENINELESPMAKRFDGDGNFPPEWATIPAKQFPTWFVSFRDHYLKPLSQWAEEWRRENRPNGRDYNRFAPPRDAGHKTQGRRGGHSWPMLRQNNMVLICPSGHISDIPWDKFFIAMLTDGKEAVFQSGYDLFGHRAHECEKGGSHQLVWLTSRNNPESYGSLKCKKCERRVSLEGIMNLTPRCPGHRPWESGEAQLPCTGGNNNQPAVMRWAVATAHSVYYAPTEKGLYLPGQYMEGHWQGSREQKQVLENLPRYYETWKRRHPGGSKKDFIEAEGIEGISESAENDGIQISDEDLQAVFDKFLQEEESTDNLSADTLPEHLRYEEYRAFMENERALEGTADKLDFASVPVPDSLQPIISRIVRVDTLSMTSTQIRFSRVRPVDMPVAQDDGQVAVPTFSYVFKGQPKDVVVLPAIQSKGEGIFIAFRLEAVDSWIEENRQWLESRYRQPQTDDFAKARFMTDISAGEARVPAFYMLHTFAHMLIRELEKTCGYPAASIQERLYYSHRSEYPMLGVLIYTMGTGEGSMGGLVWQAEPGRLERHVRGAVESARHCSADPVCWMAEDAPVFASCFACSMLPETSCEHGNMGLDRRALADEVRGFMKSL